MMNKAVGLFTGTGHKAVLSIGWTSLSGGHVSFL